MAESPKTEEVGAPGALEGPCGVGMKADGLVTSLLNTQVTAPIRSPEGFSLEGLRAG